MRTWLELIMMLLPEPGTTIGGLVAVLVEDEAINVVTNNADKRLSALQPCATHDLPVTVCHC